jgi:PiT family inorganic phosphate transporter
MRPSAARRDDNALVDGGLLLAIAVALAFSATNGLHDAANAIATLVGTRAARPAPAIVVAAAGNVVGPLLLGSAVADTVAGIVTVPSGETIAVIGAALTGAVAWNLLTWWRALPSSSGHALLGGLVGAALAEGGTGAVNWGGFDGLRPVGVIGVATVLALAPVAGFVAGLVVDRAARRVAARSTDRLRGPVRAGQWAMSGGLAISHGANDAQKAVGVIVAVLIAAGELHTLTAPVWVELAAGTALTLGTAFGGWPIVRTIGRRIVRLRPIDGLASQTGSTAVLLGASVLGAPVSTTQVVASSVVGVGGGHRRWRHVRWRVVWAMLLAWLVTVPASAAFAVTALVPWRWIT